MNLDGKIGMGYGKLDIEVCVIGRKGMRKVGIKTNISYDRNRIHTHYCSEKTQIDVNCKRLNEWAMLELHTKRTRYVKRRS